MEDPRLTSLHYQRLLSKYPLSNYKTTEIQINTASEESERKLQKHKVVSTRVTGSLVKHKPIPQATAHKLLNRLRAKRNILTAARSKNPSTSKFKYTFHEVKHVATGATFKTPYEPIEETWRKLKNKSTKKPCDKCGSLICHHMFPNADPSVIKWANFLQQPTNLQCAFCSRSDCLVFACQRRKPDEPSISKPTSSQLQRPSLKRPSPFVPVEKSSQIDNKEDWINWCDTYNYIIPPASDISQ